MANTAYQAAPIIFRLGTAVTIRDIAAVRDGVLDQLRTRLPTVLDCSAVVKADISLIQLLVAVQRMAERDRLRLDLVIPETGIVADLIRQSGLEQDFEATGVGNDKNHPVR